MAEYYAVERTQEYLMHYGIKGMRWGVHRALTKNGPQMQRALDRQYAKAQKKLAKLNARADKNALLRKAEKLDAVSNKARKIGRIGLGVATLGTGATIGTKRLHKSQANSGLAAVEALKKQRADAVRGAREAQHYIDVFALQGTHTLENNFKNDIKYYNEVAQEASKQIPYADAKMKHINTRNRKLYDASRAVQAGGAGIAALGYATSAGTKLRAKALRRRANNPSKMEDAKIDALNFKKEMNRAFAGTKYGNGGNRQGKKRRR